MAAKLHKLFLHRPSLQEAARAPEEIVEYLNAENRSILSESDSDEFLTHEQVLTLMNTAAMWGFRAGGESALSMVMSMLVMRQFRSAAADRN